LGKQCLFVRALEKMLQMEQLTADQKAKVYLYWYIYPIA
jgi:hypothetical protein